MKMSDPFKPYHQVQWSKEELLKSAQSYRDMLSGRRSVRMFSSKTVAKEVIESIVMTASSAPSGAHKQPWSFCAVSDAAIKKEIRMAAEQEERLNYDGRMSDEWLDDLAVFGTDWEKPFLEIAPWLIVVFKKPYDLGADGKRRKNYYVNESVGLASGFLIAAIHQAGLAALTHTPSPMNFLEKILKRPGNERAFLLIPVGYAADDASVPDLERKGKDEVLTFY